MDNNYCVYKHTAPNGKVYVGITKQEPYVRWGSGGKGYKQNKHFWNAICKYGWENIAHEVISDGLSAELAGDLEKQLILLYDATNPENGYNNTTGGENGFTLSERARRNASDATKKKWKDTTWRCKQMSKRNSKEFRDMQAENSRKQWRDDATREKMVIKLREKWSDAAFRKKQLDIFKDPERLSKIAKSLKDRWESDSNYRNKMQEVSQKRWADPNEHEKLSMRTKALWHDAEYREKHSGQNVRTAKAVLQFGKNGDLIERFPTVSEAEKKLNVPKAACHISQCANGKRKSAYGYVWRYDGTQEAMV